MTRLLVLVAPSGTGKTTVAKALVRAHPNRFVFSVSATTRSPRPGEVDHEDYHFVTPTAFKTLIEEGKLVEWAEVHGQLYGTPVKSLDPEGLEGRIPVLDIDVQGARRVLERIAHATVIFLLPPSLAIWIERLVGRGTESAIQIRTRLETALGELENAALFEEFLVNGALGEVVDEIIGILEGKVTSGISSLRAEALCETLKSGARAWVRRTDHEGSISMEMETE